MTKRDSQFLSRFKPKKKPNPKSNLKPNQRSNEKPNHWADKDFGGISWIGSDRLRSKIFQVK